MKKIALIFSTLLIVFLVACGGDDSNRNKSESHTANETADESSEDSDNQSENEDEPEQVNDKNENESEEENNSTDNEDETLDDIVQHFDDSGFDIGDKTEKFPEMIGASEGFGIEIDGEDIEFYEYKSDSDDLENIQSNGEVEMEDFGSLPALANGNLVMINHDEHSEENEIIEVFESF
ncbi:MAG TPA: hypothetical protein VK111_15440 [Virgibacillus sp.]|nr:hypothetical protein [Virgibacillus sp.]